MKRARHKSKFNYIALCAVIVVFCVLFLSIGWSAFQSTFNIENLSAIVRLDRDVRITGIRVSGVSSSGVSNYEEYDVSDIYTSMSLPNANSTITYEVTITNLGNAEVGIEDITGLPSNLEYTLNNYTLESVLCDDSDNTKCKLGAVTTLSITIGYKSNGYQSGTVTYVANLDFEFMSIEWVARIGTRYYETLQKAIDAAPIDGTQTTVQLIKNTSEYIEVKEGRNIVLDLQNYTVTNTVISGTGKPIFEIINGTVRMSNGTLYSTAAQGVVNVNYGSTFIMTGGTINATGQRQALYNNGGTVQISGTAYLHNTQNQRAAVQNNDARGTITITGGTIVSEKHAGIQNVAGTLIIGNNDGTISTTSPVIRGGTYAVNNTNIININGSTANANITNFEFYDGILKGKTSAVFNDTYVTKPTGYGMFYQNETIDNAVYQTGVLAIVNVVTFDPGEGTMNANEMQRGVETGHAIGVLPIPTRTNYVFDGWFYSNGTIATPTDTVNTDFTLTAHWTSASENYVAQIGQNKYNTLAAAISAVPQNTETTVMLIKNTIENITIPNTKRVILDFGNYTLTSANDNAVIENKGRCKLISGKITTNSTKTSAINNTGTFEMTGGEIEATGQRQAIYNDGGTVTISGTAVLSAATPVRGTVQNHTAGGTITILGGTIISPNFSAVVNEAGTLVLGDDDGTIDATTPILRGKDNAVVNSATFNFFDGKLMGKSGRVSGSITNHAGNYVDVTETFSGDTYFVRYLE